MIFATVIKNENGNVVEFTVKNHGESNVCAAVSMLTLNTVNSIEAFTEDGFFCDYDEAGGFLHFKLDSQDAGEGTEILLKAFELGLKSTCEEYPEEIELEIVHTSV